MDTYGVFYDHPRWTGEHTEKDGEKHKIYEDVIMVEIMIKGNKNSSYSKLKTKEHEEMYPKAWAAYLNQTGADLDGTPLKNMAGISKSQILNCQADGIETIEDLAELNDSVVIGVQGMLDLRKKAQAYIAAMDPEKLAAEQKAKDDEIAEMKKEMSEMKKALDNQVIPHKKKPRGRPRASA